MLLANFSRSMSSLAKDWTTRMPARVSWRLALTSPILRRLSRKVACIRLFWLMEKTSMQMNQDGQRDGEPPVDQEQEDKGSDDLDQGNEQVFRAVVGELGDVEEVGDQLAHHLSGIVLGIVGEG